MICYTCIFTLYVMSVHILWPADTHKPFRATRKHPVLRNYSAPRTAPVALLSTVRQGAQRSFRDRGLTGSAEKLTENRPGAQFTYTHARTRTQKRLYLYVCDDFHRHNAFPSKRTAKPRTLTLYLILTSTLENVLTLRQSFGFGKTGQNALTFLAECGHNNRGFELGG